MGHKGLNEAVHIVEKSVHVQLWWWVFRKIKYESPFQSQVLVITDKETSAVEPQSHQVSVEINFLWHENNYEKMKHRYKSYFR